MIQAIRRVLSRNNPSVRAAAFLHRQSRAILSLYAGPSYDPDVNGEYWLLRQVAPSLRTVIDVGANIGDWSSTVVSLCPNLERIVGVEPSRAAFTRLVERFAGESRFASVHAAADSIRGEIDFWEEPGPTPTSSAFQKNAGGAAECVRVPTTTIDSLIEEQFGSAKRCDLVKIDVQGLDFRCLAGAEASLSRSAVSLIQFEYGPEWLHAGATLQRASDYLESFGYTLYLLRPQSLRRLAHERLGEFFGYCNIIAASREGAMMLPVVAR